MGPCGVRADVVVFDHGVIDRAVDDEDARVGVSADDVVFDHSVVGVEVNHDSAEVAVGGNSVRAYTDVVVRHQHGVGSVYLHSEPFKTGDGQVRYSRVVGRVPKGQPILSVAR